LVSLAYPESYDPELKNWDMASLPFLPTNYKYRIIEDVEEQFYAIKKLYNRSDIEAIYYAGDAGREGIYIQALVRQEAGHNPNAKELVVWIDSHTEDEIKRGIKEAKPLSEYQNLINSGYMRAIEDYALGINLSRVLTLKYRNVLSSPKPIAVGRVMTCVLGMIVRREREIENFIPTDFYKIQSRINVDSCDIIATWKVNPDSELAQSGKLYNETGFKKKSDAADFIEKLSQNVVIEKVSVKEEKKSAPFLFNLAELQATCSRVLRISPDKTLEVVQSLYEKKLVTYPRTDARVLSTAIANEIDHNLNGLRSYNSETAEFIDAIFAHGANSKIVNSKYVDDEGVTDHYALIPTGQNMKEVSRLGSLESSVYDLIVKRFVCIFLPPAVYKKVSIIEKDTTCGERFYANGSSLIKPGYLRCIGIPEEKNALPPCATELEIGSQHKTRYTIFEGKTNPPSRYTSGSMVLAMENAGNLIEDEELRAQIKGSGIGTSATRAEVIKKLIAKGYIALNEKTQVLTPAGLGNATFEIVNAAIPELLIPEMTAKWEQELDLIAKGKLDTVNYENELNRYITRHVQDIKDATISAELSKVVAGYGFGAKDKKPQKVAAANISTYLDVPFSDKDAVKALGARWDGTKTAWYVPNGVDIEPFKKWINGSGSKTIKKITLNVPFDDKDEAKRLGARWDGKAWYIMSNMDTSKFSRWMK